MKHSILMGKKVLITAGPTREPIDQMRYISNHTGGRMGYEIASAMLGEGATVFLVSGPVKIKLEHPQLTVEKVNTACEMYLACCRYFEAIDIAVFAAAVSDYKPKDLCYKQISVSEEQITIKMVKNMDVAAAFAGVKDARQLTVGVTTNQDDNIVRAMNKMVGKNFDMIVLNKLNKDSLRFQNDLNNVSIINNDFSVQSLSPLKSKPEKISDILEAIANAYEAKMNSINQQKIKTRNSPLIY